jgi:NADP-dependent 3-hydroxy acid dehydrogenase YdfG
MSEPVDSTGVKRLSGRTAIVTGAGTGIGQGIAVAMAKQGAGIVIVGRTPSTLDDTRLRVEAAGGRIVCLEGSVADPETAPRVVARAVEEFGRLDIVVNNAHTFSPTLPLDQTPLSDFRQHMDSGFYGTLYFMQAAFPQMKDKGGSIINLAAVHALCRGEGSYPGADALGRARLGQAQDSRQRHRAIVTFEDYRRVSLGPRRDGRRRRDDSPGLHGRSGTRHRRRCRIPGERRGALCYRADAQCRWGDVNRRQPVKFDGAMRRNLAI